MRRQVDEAEPAQLARGGQAVELGLARVGPEQDPGGPIVGLEEPGERLDLVSRARQGGEVLVARPRRHEHLLQLARFAAIASGAGRGSSTTPSLPGARSRRDDRPSLQTSTTIGLSPSATTLRSSFLFSAMPL